MLDEELFWAVPDDAVVFVHGGVCAWFWAWISGQSIKTTNKPRAAMGFVDRADDMRILTSKNTEQVLGEFSWAPPLPMP